MGDVLVLGAGGFLGLNVVRAFLDAGVTPKAGRRARGNVLGLRGLGAPLVVTDFEDGAQLREAFRGVEVLVHAAAHYPKFSFDPDGAIARGQRELEGVLEAAVAAGVRRLVFVSSTATVAPRADGGPSTEGDRFPTRPTLGTYHALKWTLEERVLAERRLEVTVANPSACLGPFDWKVGTSALLVATARGSAPPHPEGRISTVDARDVGAAVVRLAQHAAPPERVVLSGEEHDAHALFQQLARRYGAPPPPPPMPAHVARVAADAHEAEAARTGGRAPLARELVDLIVHAPALDVSRSRALGVTYRPLTETLDAWDAWAQRMGLIPPSRPEATA